MATADVKEAPGKLTFSKTQAVIVLHMGAYQKERYRHYPEVDTSLALGSFEVDPDTLYMDHKLIVAVIIPV